MGKPQTEFVVAFKEAFTSRFDNTPIWLSGQTTGNIAQLPGKEALRRGGMLKQGECFELGDLRANFDSWTLLVEYDHANISMINLVKYWPYVRGELHVRPSLPLILCNFSNWWSYGSHRDLWDWLMAKMHDDHGNIVKVVGRQFDHGGTNMSMRARGIQDALDWIEATCVRAGNVPERT